MKKALSIVILIVLALAVTSCGDLLDLLLGTVTIETRLANFIEKLNTEDRSTMYLEMHPESESYDDAKTAATWDSWFPYANKPYAVASSTEPATGSVTGTMVLDVELSYVYNGAATSDTLTLMFKQYESAWYIYRIDRNGTELFRKL